MVETKRKKITIDTDPGIDDAMALFVALQSPEVEVINLTTIYGNVYTTWATRNALHLEWIKASDSSSLLEDLYKVLDEVIKLAECEIYSYHLDCDADPFFGRGVIWSFNFFFYN